MRLRPFRRTLQASTERRLPPPQTTSGSPGEPVVGGRCLCGHPGDVQQSFVTWHETATGRHRAATSSGRTWTATSDDPRAGRWAATSEDPEPEQLAGDHESLDLARPLPDLGQLRVAHEPLHRVVGDVAVSAVDLDRGVRCPG